MRIGIDAHAIGSQSTGNETYIKNLILALAEIDRLNEYVLFFTRPEVARQWEGRFPNVRVQLIRPHTPYARIPVSFPLAMYRAGVDLIHVQYTAPPFCHKPIVVTIHDLSFEHFPQFFTPRERFFFRRTIPHTARRAAKVLTVSEYSRRDIINTYRLPPEKVVVTPNGVGPEFRPTRDEERLQAVKKKYGIERPYLLSVGNLQPRKNLARLIKAYSRLREMVEDFRHQLVIVGKRAWLYRNILHEVNRSPYAGDMVFTGYVPESDLPDLYSGATVFVYPSIFEGFGLPVLEAMACGTPVITSNSSSLPEVVGEAGLMVDPYDEEAWARTILRVIEDRQLRNELAERSVQQAARFSWHRTAELTLAVYREVGARASIEVARR
ncbi:MAG: glycosyltransferase family 1 protein [Acidobacteria bacterium]|nr:MAG: glycosyltransferase family 1 protein [Acidobacteriota bacterium]